MAMKCLCGSEVEFQEIHEEFPLFDHLAYQDLAAGLMLSKCPNCGYVANRNDLALTVAAEKVLSSEEYSLSRQTTRKIIEVDGVQNFRADYQSKLICEWLDGIYGPRVLDVGCFDGLLLKTIKESRPDALCFGYEPNAYLKKGYASESLRYLEEIDEEGELDLVIYSHSIMYERELDSILERLLRVLKKDGSIFVQVPDPYLNPCNILLGDQTHYFDYRSLSSMFGALGMLSERLAVPAFPSEVLLVASRISGTDATVHVEESNSLESSLSEIIRMRDAMSELPEREFYVFGCNVNSAFADALLGDRVRGFVDDFTKGGESLRGKPILPTSDVVRDAAIVIPFGERAKGFGEKMAEKWGFKSSQLYCV